MCLKVIMYYVYRCIMYMLTFRLNAVAAAGNEHEYKRALNELADCPAWQRNIHLHSWFETKWLAEKKVH